MYGVYVTHMHKALGTLSQTAALTGSNTKVATYAARRPAQS